MPQEIVLREIGSVIADESSPSFDTFRFKANANEYVYPGTLVGTSVDVDKFLIGRVSGSLEVNPHESAGRAKVREAMGIAADYPQEELSTNIYRVYEADIIEEGIVQGENQLEITEPSDMAKAGGQVFIPAEDVIAQAMSEFACADASQDGREFPMVHYLYSLHSGTLCKQCGAVRKGPPVRVVLAANAG